MKNTKKVLLACLFAVCALGMVFAGGSKASDKTVLNVMGYGDNATAEGQSFIRIIEAFEEENPDVDVTYELLFDQAYHQKATARLASGDVPDVAYMGLGTDGVWGVYWSEAGQQIAMDPYLDTSIYSLSAFGSANADGSHSFVPLGIANMCSVVFVNTELLSSLGLSMPTTYADMKAMVSVANANGIDVLGIGGGASWVWVSPILSNFIAQTSGAADAPEQLAAGAMAYNGPEMMATLNFLKTMVDDGVLSTDAAIIDVGTAITKFNNGEYLFYMGGQWDAGSVSVALQETMDMVAFPAIPGAKGYETSVAAAVSPGYGLTKSGEAKGLSEVAMRFINYYNSKAEVEQRLRDGGISGSVLANHNLPSDLPRIAELKGALAAEAVVTQVLDAYVVGDPISILSTGAQEIILGTKTPQQIADAMEAAR